MENIDFSGFSFREGKHNDSAVIWVDFKYDRAKIDLAKSLKGRWSRYYFVLKAANHQISALADYELDF